MEMTFILPCVPTAQQRARHAMRNGQPMAYKSAGQKANERTLDALLMQYMPAAPLAGAISLEFGRCSPRRKARASPVGRPCCAVSSITRTSPTWTILPSSSRTP